MTKARGIAKRSDLESLTPLGNLRDGRRIPGNCIER
jgi:hypothetical protein